jgi:hypothetical protein
MLLNNNIISCGEYFSTTQNSFDWRRLIIGESRLKNETVTTAINSNGQQYSRILRVGENVGVYRNLNKKEYFSCKSLNGDNKGLVSCYSKIIVLSNASFKVSEASRKRVLNNKRNVHAYCEGIFLDCFDGVFTPSDDFRQITYHPRRYDFFYDRTTDQLIKRSTVAGLAILYGADVYILKNF